jgi:hypothetical protein
MSLKQRTSSSRLNPGTDLETGPAHGKRGRERLGTPVARARLLPPRRERPIAQRASLLTGAFMGPRVRDA